MDQLIKVALAIVMCFCTYYEASGIAPVDDTGQYSDMKLDTLVAKSQSDGKGYAAWDIIVKHIDKLQEYVRDIKKVLDGKPLGHDIFLHKDLEEAIGSLGQIRSLKTFGQNNYAAASASLRLASDLIGKQLMSLKKIEEDGGNLRHPVEYQAALSMFQEMDTLVKATSENLKDKVGISIVAKPDGNLKYVK
ncbi:hypothetical protein FACS1894122_05250 [Alphaproteobacteria bacterium]|nr:hypothetical protein FACS1894122_05250 [Alphaproteobacteria bacterium]